MPLTDEERVVELAATFIGRPYVWKGKGDQLFDVEKGSVPTPREWGKVFDCSGLVTYPMQRLGFQDLRFQASANVLMGLCIKDVLEQEQALHLAFFGPGKATHVAYILGKSVNGKLLLLDASGGDERTINPTTAPWGSVRVHYNNRNDLLKTGYLQLKSV